MNYELLEALGQIAREKNVDREVLIETLIAGMLSAARKRYGLSANIDMRFDRDRGHIDAKLIRRVVATVEDDSMEISLEQAREIDPSVKPGDEITEELDISEFGRGAITAAKQVLVQRVREAERERIYEEFHGREGELVHGVVQQVDRRSVLARVDAVEAILPEREALHRDRYRQGDHLTAILLEVDRLARGPQVILSRSHPDFLRRLFENEVPEISEKIVEIRGISREAGSRAKVAVLSHDERVDAVGACVGVKGSRVQNIVRELGGERIDIVPWSSDPALFVTRALSPAKVNRVDIDEAAGSVTVVVAEDQLSLAIGKGGQNVRLAMKLSGWNIELVSEEALQQGRTAEERADFDLEELSAELGEGLIERLIQEGLETSSDVLNSSVESLQAIEGVGEALAEKVMATVRDQYETRLEAARAEIEAEALAVEEAEEQPEAEPGDKAAVALAALAALEGAEVAAEEAPGDEGAAGETLADEDAAEETSADDVAGEDTEAVTSAVAPDADAPDAEDEDDASA